MIPAAIRREQETARDERNVSALAHEVLRALGSRSELATVTLERATTDLLLRAVQSSGHFDPGTAVASLLDLGVTHQELADHYVPAAARQLGECWNGNVMSFARVTVASGRLQSMLGHLGQPNDLGHAWDRTTPRVALITLAGDQHSLGWKLVTLQLRRQGICVDAMPGVTALEGADLIERSRADIVLISASRLSVLGTVADLTGLLRARMEPVPPIVLGGIVVPDLGPNVRLPDVLCITNDLDVALSHRARVPALARSRT